MASPRSRSESLEDNNTMGTGSEYSHDDDDDDHDEYDSADDDSMSGSESGSDSGDSEEEEEEFDEEDVSHLMPVEKNKSQHHRTEKQHEQQRRIVDLAACTSSDTEANYATTGSYDGSTDYEHNIGYTTTEGNTTATGYVGSSSYSVASQSTATTQPTSPSQRKKPELQMNNGNNDAEENNSLVESTMTTPDVHNRSSTQTTPRTGHFTRSQYRSPHSQSQTAPLSPRMIHHERVPGGAAAKLMLVGPKDSKESSEDSKGDIERMSSSESLKINPDVLLAAEMQRVKEEFCSGSKAKLKRFHAPPDHKNQINEESCGSEANTNASSTPSFLNKSEIFHRTAAAAVAALLKPRQSPNASSAAEKSLLPNPQTSPHAALPKTTAAESSTTTTTAANQSPDANPAVSPTLLSKETEKKLEEMQSKMHDPTKTLTDLLTAVASPDDHVPDPLGYAVRRKNACGALQTLTASAGNRVRICWTVGVLPALTSVLSDGLLAAEAGAAAAEPRSRRKTLLDAEPRIRSEYEAARNRAISALMNLSVPVRNRIAVFHSPGLVQAVLQTVEQDNGSPRRGCCAVLAFLAKSSENRLLLAQVPGLMDVVRNVLKPRPPRVEPVTTPKEKKVYPWSDEDESSSSSSDSNRPKGKDDGKPDASLVSTTSVASEGSYDSGATPKVEGAHSPRELSGYDDTADELLQGARQNLFAMLGHLVKEKDNAYHFARDLNFVTTMVEISRYQESPSHALAVKILAHLTRHRLNKVLAFKPKTVVPALVEATQSPNDDARLYASYALQNLSQEKSCRQELAIAAHLIEALCERCRNGVHAEERLAAISTLKNLCDEPANLIPMTNTTGCISTLMHLAHAGPTTNEIPVTELMQYRACDALATLSHWLRKISTSGHSLDATQKGRPPTKGLFVPSLREVSWNQWT